MPDEKKPIREDVRPVDQAEGTPTPGELDEKVMHTPSQAEGDRETVEQALKRKEKQQR